MSKLNDGASAPKTSDVGNERVEEVSEENGGAETTPAPGSSPDSAETGKGEDDKMDILRFTMLFNKYNSDWDVKRKPEEDVKYTMFFNKEVTMSSNVEHLASTNKNSDRSPERKDPSSNRGNRNRTRFIPHKVAEAEFGKPQISEPGMMFSSSLTSPLQFVEWKKPREGEKVKKLMNKRCGKTEPDPQVQLNVHPAARTDLRVYNSLTSLQKSSKPGFRGTLKSKIPSLTAIETNAATQKTSPTRFNYWDQLDDLMQSDFDKRLNLQISWSSNDNNRRSALKFKKDDAASVSDSKLLYADYESKKQIKKCDKKSRGDSSKKENETRARKQVQWKTEVDVIYFSTHLAANGDRTGEVIGRVMEPLREEWEQQRKGFYAKMVPCHLETHLKYRFISLLKI